MQPLFTQSQIDGGEFTTEDLVEAINALAERLTVLENSETTNPK